MLKAVSVDQPLPERVAPPTAVKSSSWLRKQKAPAVSPATKPPVSVDVRLDDASFRSETEFGLFETVRGRCVVVEVDVR